MHRVSTIRRARQRRGIGVRELARLAQVTPGAVTQWENSELRGSIRPATIERALQAMGTNATTESASSNQNNLERREDRVTLELHRAVAHKLIADPAPVLLRAAANIDTLRSRVRGNEAQLWVDEWESLIADRAIGAIVDISLGTDPWSINMRQTSPFAGILTEQERLAALEKAV